MLTWRPPSVIRRPALITLLALMLDGLWYIGPIGHRQRRPIVVRRQRPADRPERRVRRSGRRASTWPSRRSTARAASRAARSSTSSRTPRATRSSRSWSPRSSSPTSGSWPSSATSPARPRWPPRRSTSGPAWCSSASPTRTRLHQGRRLHVRAPRYQSDDAPFLAEFAVKDLGRSGWRCSTSTPTGARPRPTCSRSAPRKMARRSSRTRPTWPMRRTSCRP